MNQYLYRIVTVYLAIISFTIDAEEINRKTDSVDFKEILMFAEFANVAYADKEQVIKTAQEYGFTLPEYQNIAGDEVTFFLLTNEKNQEQIIVSRGTANLENVMVDMAFNLVPEKNLGIALHQGFSSSALKIYQQIKPSLKKNYHISTTGHSLGGALALILAMKLSNDHFNIEKVITFGQPKVSNFAGVDKFNSLNVLRIVNEKDIVPLVPPVDLSDIYNIKFYWHQGSEIILLENNQYARLQGIKAMMRAIGFINQQPSEQNLQHHTMAQYIASIKQKIDQPVEVAFDVNINPLELFGFGK